MKFQAFFLIVATLLMGACAADQTTADTENQNVPNEAVNAELQDTWSLSSEVDTESSLAINASISESNGDTCSDMISGSTNPGHEIVVTNNGFEFDTSDFDGDGYTVTTEAGADQLYWLITYEANDGSCSYFGQEEVSVTYNEETDYYEGTFSLVMNLEGDCEETTYSCTMVGDVFVTRETSADPSTSDADTTGSNTDDGTTTDGDTTGDGTTDGGDTTDGDPTGDDTGDATQNAGTSLTLYNSESTSGSQITGSVDVTLEGFEADDSIRLDIWSKVKRPARAGSQAGMLGKSLFCIAEGTIEFMQCQKTTVLESISASITDQDIAFTITKASAFADKTKTYYVQAVLIQDNDDGTSTILARSEKSEIEIE